MADPTPATPPPPAANAAPKAPPGNPALRMLGLPNLPRKLPSRNWMIFWTVSSAITAAIVYDKREKKRAIAKWSHAVDHLAREPLPDQIGLAQPRKLTIYLSSPPGDGLRIAQDHYTEYVKPILAASGLDWEFVQGRREGDVRAYVAERVRRIRHGWEDDGTPDPTKEPTKEEIIDAFRKSRGIKEYDGVRGDVVIGRHTWKEYLRGLHEGWLGPLAPPPPSEPLPAAATPESSTGNKPAAATPESSTEDKPAAATPESSTEDKPAEETKPVEEEKKPAEEEKKPTRPPQPKPHNTTADYSTATLAFRTPSEFDPSTTIREPHLLGFLNTPTRLYRFFNRRKLADEIGREVAAVCLSTYREYQQLASDADAASPTNSNDQPQYEQQKELAWEEKDWVKSVWKEDDPKDVEASQVVEKVLAKPIVMDPRIAERMRRFQLLPEDEERVKRIVVPEEEIEGWIKGKMRQVYRWGANKAFEKKKVTPLDDKDAE
ncbi:mitochondrial import inner membrane translocase subunit Tim54 [Chaetomidium leptoderma]|uniref:Mitochondrial import inner membrane translocase subunit TIM54 n=1 Tax=Chaetomidium leptoderma TaxID=669021 RepID=A0AAN6VRE0_9PEZI|nr:mitochondrial import inner membrane translocase subunit Tim54 [Chaetomidium leptoderma]